jgi:hypothetical protein
LFFIPNILSLKLLAHYFTALQDHNLASFSSSFLARGERVKLDLYASGQLHLRVRTPSGITPPMNFADCDFCTSATLLREPGGTTHLDTYSSFRTDHQPAAPEYVPGTAPPSAGPTPPASPTFNTRTNATASANETAASPVYVPTSSTQRWYMVSRGRQVGVFQGLSNAQKHVLGVSGPVWGRVASEHDGRVEFASLLADGAVWIIESSDVVTKVTPGMYYEGIAARTAVQHS